MRTKDLVHEDGWCACNDCRRGRGKNACQQCANMSKVFGIMQLSLCTLVVRKLYCENHTCCENHGGEVGYDTNALAFELQFTVRYWSKGYRTKKALVSNATMQTFLADSRLILKIVPSSAWLPT
jgi:hypothetical protein